MTIERIVELRNTVDLVHDSIGLIMQILEHSFECAHPPSLTLKSITSLSL